MLKRYLTFMTLLTFLTTLICPPPLYAEVLPIPLGASSLGETFRAPHFKGMIIDPADPFKFDFIFYKGDEAQLEQAKKDVYATLVKYFLTALTIPDTDQWVNLSPLERDRIIAENFGRTEMGRDMLAQDYVLKQLTSSLSDPESALGKTFWDQVYQKAYAKFGTTNIPTDLFNKVWISPKSVDLYEKDNTVFIMDQKLSVMLETDYRALNHAAGAAVSGKDDNVYAALTKDVMREVLLPVLEMEVNEGRAFAHLRQMYSGMLLAAWYKDALKESILTRVYGDQSKTGGISQNPANNMTIYEKYLASLKKGVVNMVTEDTDKHTQEVIPRKYFSGGTQGYEGMMRDPARTQRHTVISALETDAAMMEVVSVTAQPAAADSDLAQKNEGRRKLKLGDFTNKEQANAFIDKRVGISKMFALKGGARVLSSDTHVTLFYEENNNGNISSHKIEANLPVPSGPGLLFFENNAEGTMLAVYNHKEMVLFFKTNAAYARDGEAELVEGRWQAVRVDFPYIFQSSMSEIELGEDGRVLLKMFANKVFDGDRPELNVTDLTINDQIPNTIEVPLQWEDGTDVNIRDLKRGIEVPMNFLDKVLSGFMRFGTWTRGLTTDDITGDEMVRVASYESDRQAGGDIKKRLMIALNASLNGSNEFFKQWYEDFGGEIELVRTPDRQALIAIGPKKVAVYFAKYEKGKNYSFFKYHKVETVDLEALQHVAFNKEGDVFFVQDTDSVQLFSWKYDSSEDGFPASFGAWRVTKIDLPEALRNKKLTFSDDGTRLVGVSDDGQRWVLRYDDDRGSFKDVLIRNLVTFDAKYYDLQFAFTETKQKDKAVSSSSNPEFPFLGVSSDGDLAQQYGGIDFAREHLQMNIRRDGNGVPLPVSQQDLEAIHIDGLVPLLGDIRPASSLALFAMK
jgi:hypothetical protein